jgi:hypothetical protein
VAAQPLPMGGSAPARRRMWCGSPYGVQRTYAVLEPVALANLAVQDVGFVRDVVGVPAEFDGARRQIDDTTALPRAVSNR